MESWKIRTGLKNFTVLEKIYYLNPSLSSSSTSSIVVVCSAFSLLLAFATCKYCNIKIIIFFHAKELLLFYIFYEKRKKNYVLSACLCVKILFYYSSMPQWSWREKSSTVYILCYYCCIGKLIEMHYVELNRNEISIMYKFFLSLSSILALLAKHTSYIHTRRSLKKKTRNGGSFKIQFSFTHNSSSMPFLLCFSLDKSTCNHWTYEHTYCTANV